MVEGPGSSWASMAAVSTTEFLTIGGRVAYVIVVGTRVRRLKQILPGQEGLLNSIGYVSTRLIHPDSVPSGIS